MARVAMMSAVWLAVLLCASPLVDAHRKLQMGSLRSDPKSLSQLPPVILGDEQGSIARIGRRGLVLLQQDPYDAGFESGGAPIEPTPLPKQTSLKPAQVDTPPPLQITDVFVSPVKPTAQQAYNVTVFVLGASPDQTVHISVRGSDGFVFATPSCSTDGFLGGAGSCGQTIPGSPFVGSVDELTAAIWAVDGKVLVSKVVKVGPFLPKMPTPDGQPK